MNFITTVTTNALLYPKKAQKIKGLVDMLHFSLDFYDKNKHNSIRKAPCYEFVLKSIKIAKELGEKPDILMTIWDENIHDIEKIYYEIALPNNLILILNPIFHYGNIKEKLSPKNFDLLRNWANKKNIYLNTAFLELNENGGNNINSPACSAGNAVVVISPFNELILPCYHFGAYKFPIQNNLYSLWHSPKIVKLRQKAGKYDFCNGCTINCYMEPSFAYSLNKYFLVSSISTLKYINEKWGIINALKSFL